MAEAAPFQPFNLLRPTAQGSTHHVSIFCSNCKSLIVKDEDIVEIRGTEYGPEVLARGCEGTQLLPVGWALPQPFQTRLMQDRGFFNANIVKQMVICRCFYESEPVKEYFNLKKYRAGYYIFNEKSVQPYIGSPTGCVIRYGLNSSSRLEWTGDQSANALFNYEDGKLMGKWSKKEVTVPPSGVPEFSMSNIKEFHLLSTLSATVKGSLHHVSLHCNFCRSVLVRPDQIAHISVKERGDRIIWTRASPNDPDGAVIENLTFFGRKNIHEIYTQRMRHHGYWKTTILFQHVMCKCRHVRGQSFDFLRQFSIGYCFFDKKPRGVGFLDLDCDYQLKFRFYEQPPALICVVWAGDQSKNSLQSSPLATDSVEVEMQRVAMLLKKGLLSFSEDEDEKQEELKALLKKMVDRRTCSKYVDFGIQDKETAELLQEVQKERTSMLVDSVMPSNYGVCKHYQVILVGEPGAGKTSFRRAVMGEDFDEDLDSTEGISVSSTAAELTDTAQQDMTFQQTSSDTILVQALADHMAVFSHEQSTTVSESLSYQTETQSDLCMSGSQASADPETITPPYQSQESRTGLIGDIDQNMPAPSSLRLPDGSLKRIHKAKAHLEEYSEKTFVRFVDCGGQLSFLSTQTVCFGTKNTVYVLAFDVSRPLHEVEEKTFRQNGRSFKLGSHLQLSHIDYIMHWLSSIATVSKMAIEDTPSDSTTCVLLATHIDKVVNPEKIMDEVRTAINEQLLKSNLQKKLSICGPYFVDNRQPGSDMACPASEMLQVQKALRDHIKKNIEAVRVPLLWLLLVVILEEMQNISPVLTVENFTSLPVVAEVVNKSHENVGEMLAFLNDIGRIRLLHEVKNKSEPDMIFLNPEWLVKEITKVMSCSMVDYDKMEPNLRKDVAQLKENGVLTKRLYSHLWKDHSLDVQQALLQIMELYGLQAPILRPEHRYSDETTPTKHWVPSCLQSDKSSEISKLTTGEGALTSPPMLLVIDDFFIPQAIFPCLIVYLFQLREPQEPVLAATTALFDSSSLDRQSRYYLAQVSVVDRGILIAVHCGEIRVALGELHGVPHIAEVAQKFCADVCRCLQRTSDRDGAKLKFHPEFVCLSSPDGKPNWVKVTLPVQFHRAEATTDADVSEMLLWPTSWSRVFDTQRIPGKWLTWSGRLDKKELLGDELQAEFDGEVRGRDIPYLPCQLIHAKMEDSGVELHLAGVSARYPAGALPVNTNICMMVRPIELGFSFNGVTFSPQVIVGPHLDSRLTKPLTLTFPLELRGRVTAFVSKTAAQDVQLWHMMPESSIGVLRDRGCVEVTAYEHCRYQVQSGDWVFNVMPEFVYFSVSAKLQKSIYQLLLRCSSDRDSCKPPDEDFQLCHKVSDINRVEVIDGDELCLSMVSDDKSILQRSSPFNNEMLRCTLDEQFSILVKAKQPNSRSERGWTYPFLSIFGRSEKPEKTEGQEKNYPWLIALPSGYGEGYLEAYSQHLSEVDGRGSSMVITFKIGHPEGCEQLPASEAGSRNQPKEASLAPSRCSTSHRLGSEPPSTCTPPAKRKKESESVEQDSWKRKKIIDEKAKLFDEFTKSEHPFCGKWEDIVRRLPAATEESHMSQEWKELPRAYSNPDNIIENIRHDIKMQTVRNFNSACLLRALNDWTNDQANFATLGHLFDILVHIHVGGAASEFFEKYFSSQ